MDPAPEKIQSGQEQQSSGGGIGRGINTINNLVGFGKRGFNPLAGGSKAVTAAKFVAKGFVRLLGSWAWTLIPILVSALVSIIVFLMSMFTFFFQ
jgi:hypothetical protein